MPPPLLTLFFVNTYTCPRKEWKNILYVVFKATSRLFFQSHKCSFARLHRQRNKKYFVCCIRSDLMIVPPIPPRYVLIEIVWNLQYCSFSKVWVCYGNMEGAILNNWRMKCSFARLHRQRNEKIFCMLYSKRPHDCSSRGYGQVIIITRLWSSNNIIMLLFIWDSLVSELSIQTKTKPFIIITVLRRSV